MVKKSTTSIRESKSKRYKLKKKICKLLDSDSKEDFLLGLELSSKLSEMQFRNILKYCENIDSNNFNTEKKNSAVYFIKSFENEIFKSTEGYSESIADHYIEFCGNIIYIDTKRYVKEKIEKDQDNRTYIFENEETLKYFLKTNPKYEKYFRTTGGNSN